MSNIVAEGFSLMLNSIIEREKTLTTDKQALCKDVYKELSDRNILLKNIKERMNMNNIEQGSYIRNTKCIKRFKIF